MMLQRPFVEETETFRFHIYYNFFPTFLHYVLYYRRLGIKEILEATNMSEETVKIEETVVGAVEEVNEETEVKESAIEIEPLFEEYVDFETFSKSDFRVVKVKECSAVKKSKKLLHFVLDDGTGTDRIILSGIHAFYEPEELVGKTLLAITNLPPRKMMGIDSCGMLMSAVHNVAGEEKLNLIMLDDAIPAGAKLY